MEAAFQFYRYMKEVDEISVSRDEVRLKEVILRDGGEKLLKFVTEQVPLNIDRTILLPSDSDTTYEISNSPSWQIKTIIDLGSVNYKNNLNTYFKLVNSTLPDAGMYIGCAETITERWKRFRRGYGFMSNFIWVLDFIVNRVFAKTSLTKAFYSFASSTKYFVLSKAEILGRLSHAGFEIIDTVRINNMLYYSAMKTNVPEKDKNVSTGLLLAMKRVGKDGKMVNVYKVRTMHPYSQFIQDYVVKMHGYNEVGKPNHDFRITSWSSYLRKLHLDELPQLLNVLKGDLALVGVRPLTKFGYESLPKDLQDERIKYKPGCIPPNVSLGLKGFDGVIQAERIYLNARKRYGLIINFKYFWMAIYNMAMKRNMSA